MQVKNLMLGAAVAAVLVSCGEASSNTQNPDSTTTTTQTTRSKREVVVPGALRTSFEAKFPQANQVTWDYPDPVVVAPVEWEWTDWPTIDSNDYVAHFNLSDNDYWVWYDQNGDWIGTVEEVPDNSLPPAVNHTIKTQFPDYTIKSIDKENDKNRTAYEIKMENGEDKMKALIAENGDIMKKKGKENGVKIKEKNNPKDAVK